MHYQITIETDNAAFDPHNMEVARILRHLAARIEGRAAVPGEQYNLRDINGNTVGRAEVVEG